MRTVTAFNHATHRGADEGAPAGAHEGGKPFMSASFACSPAYYCKNQRLSRPHRQAHLLHHLHREPSLARNTARARARPGLDRRADLMSRLFKLKKEAFRKDPRIHWQRSRRAHAER